MFIPHTMESRLAVPNDANDPVPPRVICAWPLSGQYGFGSRLLFYLLIVTCVIARKREWLRNTFLAATLLFPVVAALHGIVLAANHVDGAVDMDIFGAFQLCSLGILAGPVAARVSRTYFAAPGRNTIFLWVSLILAGLLSLTVEFYRSQTHDCTLDKNSSIPHDPAQFPYGPNTTCGLTCSTTEGPFSALRGGSANDIYVIPAPRLLTFRTATLLSAGCCVHAVVWLFYMLEKILREEERKKINRTKKKQAGQTAGCERAVDEEQRVGEANADRASGVRVTLVENVTNGAVRETDGRDNRGIFKSLTQEKVVTIFNVVLFGGAGLAVLAIGEWNFHSAQLLYETEPLSSIGKSLIFISLPYCHVVLTVNPPGQWSSIVTAVLAAIGSLYIPLHADMVALKSGGEIELDPKRTYKVARFFQARQIELNKLMSGIVRDPSSNEEPYEYPTIPGEEQRAPRLSETQEIYSNRSRSPSVISHSISGDSGGERRSSGEVPLRQVTTSPSRPIHRLGSNLLEVPAPSRPRSGRGRHDTR